MNYKVYARVNIADLPVINTKTINELFKDILRSEISDYKTLSGFKSEISVTEINDNDTLIINIEVVTRDLEYTESTDRLLRRIVSTSINKFCDSELESVVFEIVSLEVRKSL